MGYVALRPDTTGRSQSFISMFPTGVCPGENNGWKGVMQRSGEGKWQSGYGADVCYWLKGLNQNSYYQNIPILFLEDSNFNLVGMTKSGGSKSYKNLRKWLYQFPCGEWGFSDAGRWCEKQLLDIWLCDLCLLPFFMTRNFQKSCHKKIL